MSTQIRGGGGGAAKPKPTTSVVKKPAIESVKHKSISVVSKSEVKVKTTSSPSKTTVAQKTTRVRAAKKVYTLAGQKFDVPEEREPLRIFYESLSKQIPSSEMAEFWMMEHGLLSPERSKKAYEKKQRRQQQLRMGTPIKSAKQESLKSPKQERPQQSSQKASASSSKNGDLKPKKRINYSDDDDEEFVFKLKKSKK
ncbi:hypothetical protein QJS10_CPA06g00773 [Acorus calamus]|uniref:Uncharacterized protein n=1 Tax=Acorus calamus TaxID=4465 RepID=A0AAV9ERN2_ACOCL|nr:hypothetical protein QJS10_CPA06g00773 [Acorus calamus]